MTVLAVDWPSRDRQARPYFQPNCQRGSGITSAAMAGGCAASRGGSTVTAVWTCAAAELTHRGPVFCGAGLPRQSEMLRSLARMNLVSTQHAMLVPRCCPSHHEYPGVAATASS